ncbi:AP complex subunit sigma [Mycena indigotica]|uniref:AP complex subunit sigma n=1 Tax=Mycena indigotica TaxID=2126181 RepID=A0A8H6W5M9_9AGAR|nr:AP complex subunit sigma [Mycena indigotica]KAF7306704.1 AP complex subunit sigma [Mycena indigotica]
MLNYVLLISRQGELGWVFTESDNPCVVSGKVRLAKWYKTMPSKAKARIVQDVTTRVLARRPRMCNVLEYKDTRLIYRRYASLFFVCAIDPTDNELITLEVLHRYVEILDRYFSNVTELDLIFNFQKAYAVLDELVLAGEMQESSRSNTLRCVQGAEAFEANEVLTQVLKESSLV